MKTALFFFSVLLLACTDASSKKSSPFEDSITPPPRVQRSYVTDSLLRLHTITDSSNSYVLYLPPAYDTLKKWPLVIFLDPHASGSFPVQQYRKIAAAYGYVIAGSNRSENGMAPAISTALVNDLLADLGKRISLDNRRVVLCGFSGGARVAGYTALQRNDLAAVISCSAGIAAETAPGFLCISTAGIKDMNYNEVEGQHRRLEQQNAKSYFFPFGGKHEWPPFTIMSSAFATVTLDAMRTGTIPKDNLYIDSLLTVLCDNGVSEGKADQLVAAAHFGSALQAIRGLSDTTLPAKLLNGITGTQSFRTLKKQEAELLDKEKNLQTYYAQALANEPLIWWPQNLKGIDTIPVAYTQVARRVSAMHYRLWAYLSLMSYSYANQALKQNNFPAADHFINVYKIVDPRNNEWAVMLATLEIKQQQPEKALKAMRQAVQLGFKDKNRILKDAAFQTLWSDKRLLDLFVN